MVIMEALIIAAMRLALHSRCNLPLGIYYFQNKNNCTYDSLLRDWETPEVEKDTSTPYFAVAEANGKNTKFFGTPI